MAFHHVILFRWKPGTSAEQIDDITTSLRALSETLSGCRSYRCGESLGLSETTLDFGVVAEFEDRAAWDAYMADTEHDRIRSQLIAPVVAERAGIQFES
jgi:quinol monooxygenase YgiN